MATRDLKGLTIEIGGDTSNLTDALRNVDGELSNLQSNLRTVNSALRLDPGNVDALAQRQELLNEAVQTTSQRLDTLREAQRQADEAIANGVEVDQRAYRNLQSEIIRAEASLNDYQRQANETGDASREAAEESAEGWTIVKDVIADLASQAIQAAIDAFKELLFEGEAALDLLQAKIGASNDAMREYGDVARDIFKNGWGESLSDVAEAIGTVTQMLGSDMPIEELQAVTEHALTLRDVFGWDVKESIRAANSLMNQFGITSDEAFNLMVQGAQNGLDQNDDLLDTINEYSVQFKDAGYSANDMFNMLNNGTRTGTWSVDKLGDAVKEMNIRFSDHTVGEAIAANAEALGLTGEETLALTQALYDGGEAGKAAMKKVLDGILAIENPTLRYQMGVQTFGTMWEDLGETTIAALMQTEGGIDAVNAAMQQVETDAYDNLATSVTTLGRTLKAEILEPIVTAIAPAIKGLVDWMIQNMNIVKPIIIGVATAFGVLAGALAISGIISAVSKAMTILNATLLANPIALVVAAIAGLVAAFVTAYNSSETFRNGVNTALQAVWAVVKPIAEAIGNAFVQAWEAIKAAWVHVAPFFNTIWENIKVGVEAVKKILANAFSTAWEVIKNVWSVASSFFQNVWNTIAGIFSVVKSVLSGDFAGAWEAIKGIVSGWAGYFQTVWNSIKNIFSSVTSFFRNTFQSAWNAIKGVFSNWGQYFSGLWNEIVNGFKQLPSKIRTIGSDIVKGLWNGINDMASWIGGKIKGFGNNVLSGIKDFFGIASPSKVMRDEVGRFLAEGIGIGIEDNADSALDPMKELKDGLTTLDDIDALKNNLTAFDGLSVNKSINVSGGAQTSVQRLTTQLGDLYTLVSDVRQLLKDNAKKNIYLDKNRLVGELASDMDAALGEIAERKAVGAV